jgi:putative ABC transport system ATP-binding protein
VATVIEVQDLARTYDLGEMQVKALQGVSFTVPAGQLLTVMGPSGSGKSTLMNILGCLDRPSKGTYMLDGEDVSHLDDDQLAAIRNRRIGFVFQTFNLLARTSALENVELPLIYGGDSLSTRRQRAQEALESVGLGERLHHHPNELSGGQQQRVAIARALVNRPSIILADEPTGNLDSKAGVEVMRLLQELNTREHITILIVTHDPFIARHTERILRIQDGLLFGDDAVEHPLKAGETARPSEVQLQEPMIKTGGQAA